MPIAADHRVLNTVAQYGSLYDRRSFVDRAVAFSCFIVLLAANVLLFSPHVAGVPVRSLISAATLVLCAAIFPGDALLVLRNNVLLLILAAGLALEGSFVSFVNGAPVSDVVQQVIEVHVQTAVVLLAAATLARVCGPRACIFAIVAVIGLTASVAVLQLMHVEAAWAVRHALGPLAADENSPNLVDQRPTGLSFSPIWLATQLCLAFAAFAAVRDKEQRAKLHINSADPLLIIGLGVFFVTCIASGTRAPILGGLIFLVLYAVQRRSSWLALLVLASTLLMYIVWPLVVEVIQSSSPRVMVTDDNSAAARVVFAYYGIRLFLANPLGYGLTFDPTQLWPRYWSDLYTMKAAAGAQVHPLHDYSLSMINMYGIGILLFVPLVVRLLKQSRASLIFFVPYIVQISFHNSGPFYNDMILWFAVAAVSAGSSAANFQPREFATASSRIPFSQVRPGARQAIRRAT